MWVVATLFSLAVFLTLVLCMPLDMVLHADVYGKPKFRLRFSWFFGLVNKEVTRQEKEVKGKRKPGKRNRKSSHVFKILRVKGLLRQFKNLIKDILSCFKIGNLEVNFRLGLGDPADTGLLFALITPATLLLSSSFPHQIRIEPSFADEAVFEGYSHGKVRLRPIQLIPPLLKFVFSPATLRTVKMLVSRKWKRGK